MDAATIFSLGLSIVGAIASIFGVLAYIDNRSDRHKKEREEKELDDFYVWCVDTMGKGNPNTIMPELGSKEFFLAEKLVIRGQLSRHAFCSYMLASH